MTYKNLQSNPLGVLTGSQTADLCRALQSAFLNEEQLEMMLLFQLEERLNNIPAAETHLGLILNLVKWAISNGKLQELLVGASKDNPTNSELRIFVDKNLQDLLIFASELIPSDSIKSLVSILKQIGDFSCVIECLRKTERGIIDNRSQDIDLLKDESIAPQIKWLTSLNLLLNIYTKRSDDKLYIVDFVENLRCREEIESRFREQLDNWLQGLPESIQPARKISQEDTFERADCQDVQKLYGYFLVIVDYPEETASQPRENRAFPVKGYLLTRVGTKGGYSQLEEVSLALNQHPSSSQNSPGEEETVSGRTGFCCSFSQIKENIDYWAEQTLKDLVSQCLKLRKSDIPNLSPSPVLTLEVFLPFDYLLEPVDEWPTLKKPFSSESLGKKRHIVVRSSDRVSYDDPYVALIETWEWAKPFLGQEDRIRKEVKPLRSWDDFAPEAFNQRLLGLTLYRSLNLLPNNNKSQCEALFGSVIRIGIPIVIGLRRKLLPGLQADVQTSVEETEDFEGFFTSDCLCNLDHLMEKALDTRKSASHDHLSVWCDEPDRLVELKARRLSA